MADDPKPFTPAEFRELSKWHTIAADKAERIGPNVAYARTFRACAMALKIAADWMDNEELITLAHSWPPK